MLESDAKSKCGVQPLSAIQKHSNQPVSNDKPGADHPLHVLQVYRGLAAVLVVLHHARGIVPAYFGGGENPLLAFFAFGKAGVQFFFVLSGFIIYYIHRVDIGSPSRLLPYITKRVIRIYPVYVFVTLLFVPFWMFVPQFGEPYHKDVSALILSLLLFPQGHLPHLGVAWTLVHEMIFYVIFSGLILNRVLGTAGLVAWIAAIALANSVLGAQLPFQLAYFLSINNLLFGLGIVAAWLAPNPREGSKSGVVVFVLGNIGFLAIGLLADSIPQPTPTEQCALILGFGIAALLIVLQAKNTILDRMAARRPVMRLLGDASYSIYLIHYPLLSVCCKALKHVGAHWPSSLSFLLISLLAVLCGMGLHICIEKPILKLLRKRLLPRVASTSTHSAFLQPTQRI